MTLLNFAENHHLLSRDTTKWRSRVGETLIFVLLINLENDLYFCVNFTKMQYFHCFLMVVCAKRLRKCLWDGFRRARECPGKVPPGSRGSSEDPWRVLEGSQEVSCEGPGSVLAVPSPIRNE